MTVLISNISQQNTLRLIPSGRQKDPALLPLASNQGELSDLAELEGATNQRLISRQIGLPDLDPAELVYGVPNFTYINAAFTHTRSGGNRFSDENRGAWYCAFAIETALKEVGYHLTRALENVGVFDNTTDYIELFADFIGDFHDLRPISPPPACFNQDILIGYPAGQQFSHEIRDANSRGLIYPSVRHQGGICLVVFVPNAVQNVRPGTIWRMEWQGNPTPDITRL